MVWLPPLMAGISDKRALLPADMTHPGLADDPGVLKGIEKVACQ